MSQSVSIDLFCLVGERFYEIDSFLEYRLRLNAFYIRDDYKIESFLWKM